MGSLQNNNIRSFFGDHSLQIGLVDLHLHIIELELGNKIFRDANNSSLFIMVSFWYVVWQYLNYDSLDNPTELFRL